MMTMQVSRNIGMALLAIVGVSCATPAEKAANEAFLDKIAEECKPLIIGSENLGQALNSNGVGADPDKYHDFLTATKALYYGNIPPAVYRNSLTAQLGGGSYNEHSFNCIVSHLPKN